MAARSFFAWRMAMRAGTQDELNYMCHVRASARARYNPLVDLTETEFRKRYRLSKKAVKFLCKELRRLTNLTSSQRVTLEVKVLTALFFFASGSYQRPVGVAKHLSQKMCSVYIEEVTQALTHRNIINKYIRFPDTPAARQAISQRFYTKYGVPGVIGCIDGSHFKIVVPRREEEHCYYSRKHYHSLNVQMICDDEYRIINVNTKFGGANHDSFIWENSNINNYMQQLHQNGEIVWLLGDSGYPQRPWLMIPYLDATPGTLEANYNNKHMVARVVIENTFGRLKNRWRCLHKDRVLHYKPLKSARIIQACCVLYNLGINFGITDTQDDMDLERDLPDDEDDDPEQLMSAIPEGTPHVPYRPPRRSDEEIIEKSREYYEMMAQRRTVRTFSPEPIPQEVLDNLIKTAGTSPSGAHTEPWTFVVVQDPDIKEAIRNIVEEEEELNYRKRMSRQWVKDLEPFATNFVKQYISDAPALLLIFRQTHSWRLDGKKKMHYYSEISTAISAGILLTAIHYCGLVALTSTPLNCNARVKDLLSRPSNERLELLLPVGRPHEETLVPDLQRKPLEEIRVKM